MQYVNFLLLLLLLSVVLTVGWYGTLRPCEILQEQLESRGLQTAMVQSKLADKSQSACLRAAYRASAREEIKDPATLF